MDRRRWAGANLCPMFQATPLRHDTTTSASSRPKLSVLSLWLLTLMVTIALRRPAKNRLHPTPTSRQRRRSGAHMLHSCNYSVCSSRSLEPRAEVKRIWKSRWTVSMVMEMMMSGRMKMRSMDMVMPRAHHPESNMTASMTPPLFDRSAAWHIQRFH